MDKKENDRLRLGQVRFADQILPSLLGLNIKTRESILRVLICSACTFFSITSVDPAGAASGFSRTKKSPGIALSL